MDKYNYIVCWDRYVDNESTQVGTFRRFFYDSEPAQKLYDLLCIDKRFVIISVTLATIISHTEREY